MRTEILQNRIGDSRGISVEQPQPPRPAPAAILTETAPSVRHRTWWVRSRIALTSPGADRLKRDGSGSAPVDAATMAADVRLFRGALARATPRSAGSRRGHRPIQQRVEDRLCVQRRALNSGRAVNDAQLRLPRPSPGAGSGQWGTPVLAVSFKWRFHVVILAAPPLPWRSAAGSRAAQARIAPTVRPWVPCAWPPALGWRSPMQGPHRTSGSAQDLEGEFASCGEDVIVKLNRSGRAERRHLPPPACL